jgi:hypothetical protein
MLEQHEMFYILFSECVSVLWQRFDWILPIFHKTYLKSGPAAGLIENVEKATHTHSSDTLI